jgi:Leucine-rich repeat (LRR) protein
LYIQNKTASPKNEETATQKGLKTATTKDATTPTPEAEKQMASNLKKYGVVCKRFKSLDEALNSPEIACGLDLSGQNLTSLPNDVTKLTNLNEIDISDNSLKTFPTELLKLPNLYSIDLSNNQITTVPPKVFQDQSLQNINLTGNPVKNPSKSSTGSDSAGLHIEY